MIENLDILFNVTGQTLYFDEPTGRASSITASQVFENCDGDDATAESALTGSAAVETNPNTTFDAASGAGQPDPRVCNLTATTGISIGRWYLVTNAAGETELAEVIAISSGASVTMRHELKNAYAAADTFEGTRISHSIDSTWVADTNNISVPSDPNPRYRWRLEYVVDGATKIRDIYFDLNRYTVGSTVNATDMEGHFPGWVNILPTEHLEDRGAKLIANAYRVVKLDIRQTDKADQAARNREVVEDLVMHKAVELGLEAALLRGGNVDERAMEIAAQRYTERFNNFLVAPKLQFDDTGDGGAANADAAPVWRR